MFPNCVLQTGSGKTYSMYEAPSDNGCRDAQRSQVRVKWIILSIVYYLQTIPSTLLIKLICIVKQNCRSCYFAQSMKSLISQWIKTSHRSHYIVHLLKYNDEDLFDILRDFSMTHLLALSPPSILMMNCLNRLLVLLLLLLLLVCGCSQHSQAYQVHHIVIS